MEKRGRTRAKDRQSRTELDRFANEFKLFEEVGEREQMSTKEFWLDNCTDLTGYLNYLSANKQLTAASINMHRGIKRKATGDPYFKHLFFCGYLLYVMTDDYPKAKPAHALFHDAVELKRKEQAETYSAGDMYQELLNYGVNEEECRSLALKTAILTPPEKDKNITEEDWLGAKDANFREILNIDAAWVKEKYGQHLPATNPPSEETFDEIALGIKLIKCCDVAANLRESLVDLMAGIEGLAGRDGLTDISWRAKDFEQRIAMMKSGLDQNFSLLTHMKADLRELQKILAIDDKGQSA